MRHGHQQAGFTLIELMIVVAVIGILAAIAIPQYQVYVAKSQVARVVAETGSQKVAVEECALSGKVSTGAGNCEGTAAGSNLMDGTGSNTVSGGAPGAGLGAPVLAFVGGDGGATLTSTFGNSAVGVLTGSTVVWTRNGAGSWECGTTVPKRYDHASCPTSSAE